VRLSALGTSANIWPIVPAPNDRWWVCSSRWNENWQEKPKYSEKTCPIPTLSITNATWPDLGSNPGRRGGKPAANRLSYGTADSILTSQDTAFPLRCPKILYCIIERAVVSVALQSRYREVFGSNLNRDTGYPEWVFVILSIHPGKYGDSTSFRNRPFLPNNTQLIILVTSLFQDYIV
jgi:hypothetical protein